MKERKEMVESPNHYNSHPSGRECIDIVRYYCFDIGNAMKYLWWAGLKEEADLTVREKEVEDCRKAIWYLQDYIRNINIIPRVTMRGTEFHPSGLECEDVAAYFNDSIAQAFREIWWVGVVVDGYILRPRRELLKVWMAIKHIKEHIQKISQDESA